MVRHLDIVACLGPDRLDALAALVDALDAADWGAELQTSLDWHVDLEIDGAEGVDRALVARLSRLYAVRLICRDRDADIAALENLGADIWAVAGGFDALAGFEPWFDRLAGVTLRHDGDDGEGLAAAATAWLERGETDFFIEPAASLVMSMATREPSREWMHWSLQLSGAAPAPQDRIGGIAPIREMALVPLHRLHADPRCVPPQLIQALKARYPAPGARQGAA